MRWGGQSLFGHPVQDEKFTQIPRAESHPVMVNQERCFLFVLVLEDSRDEGVF